MTPPRGLDFRGAILAAVGLGGITYALIEAPGRDGSPLVLAASIGGGLALVAFVFAERRSANPMMPLSMFSSRQFSAANTVAFVVFGALSGVFFLLVAFLQISLGYSPLAAGAASLPITALMLFLSPAAGDLAQRIGPRIPLTVGPLVSAVGLLLMSRIDPRDSYVSSVLPAVIVFGLGLTLVVAPVTATVMAAADERHSGIASGINTAVSRLSGRIIVAVLPLVAGLTGSKFYDPAAMDHGFHVAMLTCAGLAVAGGVLAWLTISSEVPSRARAEVAFDQNVDLDERILRIGGVIATFATGSPTPTVPYWPLGINNITVRFLGNDDLPEAANQQAAKDLTAAMRTGGLRYPIVARFDLEQIAEAHETAENIGSGGRVIVIPDRMRDDTRPAAVVLEKPV